jgi:hypothetical protein
MVYSPYPVVQQRGGLPGWAVALIAGGVSVFIVLVLAAIAIPTFLSERARTEPPQIPDRIGALTKSTDEAVQRDVAQLALNVAPGMRDKQAAAFVDGSGNRQVFVITAGFLTRLDDASLAGFERGYWETMRAQVPLGMRLSSEAPRHSGRLGGRVTCAPLISAAGVVTGSACLAVDAHAAVGTIELSPSGQLDPTLIDTVREAVLPRR